MNKYEDVIESCSGLIYMIIKRYFNNYEIEDLYQVGALGVIKAYNNYKDNKNTKFSTYAYKYIYGEIYSYVNNYKLIKVSRDNYTLYKKINEARIILSQKLMKEPTNKELSHYLEIEQSLIDQIISSMNKVDSLDKKINEEYELNDLVRDKRDYYNIDYLFLTDEINKLPDFEKKLISLRYYQDKTQEEVASILGINQVEVSRNEKKTLKKIRQNCQNIVN